MLDEQITASKFVETLKSHVNDSMPDQPFEIHRFDGTSSCPIAIGNSTNSLALTHADFHFRVGKMAKCVKGLSHCDRISWALNRKREGNEFFRSGDIDSAIAKYLDACVGLDFGVTELEAQEARELIQVPVLTNLAACFLQKRRFQKALEACNEALELNPGNTKALIRRFRACIHLGKLDEAKLDIEQVEKISDMDTVRERKLLARELVKMMRYRSKAKHIWAKTMRSLESEEDHYDSEKKGKCTPLEETPSKASILSILLGYIWGFPYSLWAIFEMLERKFGIKLLSWTKKNR